ncbi:aminomethyltransferase family protein [Candidatus Pseudothioglobus singularis]|nr:aminomethyltransferase family protein [Candidatus Pseudothioglobus singularis]MDB4847643.1 aminomethyltransferase family protein [Candidatus Pseudothioglobus singularis]
MRVSNIRYNGDCETYQILGGEAISIDLKSGDSVEIVDVEGDQKCNVLAFDSKKLSALSSLNWNTKPKNNSNKISSDDCSKMLKAILNGKKIKSKEFQAAELFSESSPADTRQSFNTNNDLLCVFDAEGGPMLVDQQNSPTEILINVSRSNPTIPSERLPEPLAKPTKEIRVKDSSAVAYKVKAGEYIQIIDVEGQQCSDFQAFIEEDLNNNLELCLDPTVTRSQMLASYPAPGTHDKFYNQNSVPLVEVIQDTVCRHDTFGLACNAKYYEDRGFPGHISCTDNFNSSLAEFGVAPRRNWAAVNLFFNTAIEECHSLSSDVSWSRPGDYVLLKAVDDLVCVSSACPDDTTSSNGWNPTDIHVRIYDKSNNFSSATAFRPDPQSIPTMTKETGFHKNTSKLTKNFDNYNGYWLPLEYTNLGAIKEYWQAREGVVMIDLAPLRKFEIYGQDSEVLMQYAITKDVRKLAIGQVVYSAMCYDNGCMIDDGTLFRLDDNNFRWIGGSDDGGKHLRKIAEDRALDVRVKSSTDQLHNVAVQGPKSRETLSKIIWIPKLQTTIEDLKWFRFTIGRIGGEFGIPVMVSRTGYSGELGYEVFAHPKDCEAVWDAIAEAGEEFDICPLGLNALDMLRIEAGLIFAGYEFCDQTDPFEAGIAFTVPLKTKEDDFSGKESLILRKNSPQRVLVGLELDSNEVAIHGDGVYIGKQQVGIITSATRSPILKKNIALCRISVSASEIDNEVEVGKLDGHHKRLSAKVVRFPFYDPEKTRVRM